MTFQMAHMSGLPVLHNASSSPCILLVLQPLFEEANRVRRTLVLMCRHLDSAGFGVVVPDLPGMGEHSTYASDARLSEAKQAVAGLAATLLNDHKQLNTLGFRAGCLFDAIPSANAAWRFAPEPGDRLVRTMMRTESPEESDDVHAFVQGQKVSRSFLFDLSVAELHDSPDVRTVRLATDRAPADLYVEASPVWRHAEPGEDTALARYLADDIIDWAKSCAAT